jgi:hypothetical protein
MIGILFPEEVNLTTAQTSAQMHEISQLSSLSDSKSLTYSTGAWDVDFSKLNILTRSLSVNMDVAGFSRVIEEYFLPLNMRLVCLYMQWDDHANTPTTDVRYLKWVDDWLTACDNYGIANIFYIRQWGTYFAEWDNDVLRAKPELQNLDRNGQPLPAISGAKENPIALGHPEALEQYKDDLRQLYQYYGHHPSWIGFGAYHGDYRTYGSRFAGRIKNSGFHSYHLKEFANSVFFLRDVNQSGYHSDGTKCKFWEMYKENSPLIKVKSGDVYVYPWTQPEAVYGNRMVAIKFRASDNMKGFKILFYGQKQGSPSDLTLQLYEDENDSPKFGAALETVMLPSGQVSSSKSWQGPITFSHTLAKGDYYWILMSTNGDSFNNYLVSKSDYRITEAHLKVSENGVTGPWNGRNNGFLIVQDLTGSEMVVYPYQSTYNRALIKGGVTSAIFTATETTSVNTLFLFLADRAWANDPTPVPVKLIRMSDNSIIAEGEINQSLFKGVYYWTPVQLTPRIILEAGQQYRIEVGPNPSTILLQPLAIKTDPAKYGFQGQGDVLLFTLADVKINTELANFDHIDITGPGDPINSTNWMAIGFQPTITSRLKSVEIMLRKQGNPSDLKVSLYTSIETSESDVGTFGKPGTELESKTVSVSSIVSDSWLTISNWATVLQANSKYWIVFSQIAPSTGEYRATKYKTNQHIFPHLYSRDGGRTWKWSFPIINTPPDISAKISTESESWRGEPEDRTLIRVSETEWIAQSFTPTNNLVIRGFLLLLSPGQDGWDKVSVQVRTDSGTDTPSTTVLAEGIVKPGLDLYSSFGLALVDFAFPVSLSQGTKYWLVINSKTSQASAKAKVYVSYYREPQYSFGGTAYKAKFSSNAGDSWTLAGGREGDIVFALLEATEYANVYSMSEISDDFQSYHASNFLDEPSHGWNAYLNFITTRLLAELRYWFEGYTGKSWIALDVTSHELRRLTGLANYLVDLDFGNVGPLGETPPNSVLYSDCEKKVLNLLKYWDVYPWSSLGQPLDNLGYITPEQVGLYYRLLVPLLARQTVSIFDWSSEKLMNTTQQQWSRFYGEILSRMRYTGDFYGKEKAAVKALFIGDMDIGTTLIYLTPTVDVTLEGFYGIKGDYNLTKYGDFSQFDVIVWLSSRPSMSEITVDAKNRIKAFVQNGGGFVAIAGWDDWANEILGFDSTGESISLGLIAYVNYSHPIIKPFTDISEYTYYWRNRKIVRTTGTYIVKDSNNLPWISENTYGSGRGIFIGIPINRFDGIGTHPTYYGAPRSSWLVLFTNAIFYAAGKENMLPVWWFENTYRNQHPWHSELRYSVNGKPGGPILLWISNNNVTTNFEFHLKASFYGIDPKGWIAIDVQRWKVVAKGSGEDITISTEVPAKSWMPIYITNATSNLRATYSNLPVAAEETNQKSGSYTLVGFYNQTGWLVVSSLTSPTTVIANNTGTLSQSQSIENLNSSTVKTGWYYNSDSKLLFIKFRTTSPVQILITQPSSGYTLADFPQPMLTADRLLNNTIVIASSTPHGPCGGAHTMDVMGATLVAAKLGLKAKGGAPLSILDDSLAGYDPQSGAITIRDATNNLIVFGGPGVNMVTKYYNELKDEMGNHVLQAYFLKNAEGKDYIYVSSSGKSYFIEYDVQGRKRADYSLIELYNESGRWVLVVAGLGGEGTWAASKILATYENWNLNGNAVIVKYSDTNADGYLDTITVEESIYGTYSEPYYTANIGLNTDLGVITLPLTLMMCGIYLFSSPLRRYAKIKKLFTIATFTFLITGTILMESNIVGAAPQYSLSNFPYPFISESKLLNYTFVVADSNGHAPCGGAHTMDVMGAILVAKKLGMTAVGGMPESVMDDYIASYDSASYSLTLVDTVHNLVSFGGPGVNMVTKYYNDLKDQLGNRLLKAYFLKDNLGVDYIYVQTTGKAYYIEYDAQGRKKTDYAMIQVYYDQNYGRWVLVVAGLGGEGTWAASKVLATYENWSLSGTVAIVKYYDSNKDGYLDTITIAETVA